MHVKGVLPNMCGYDNIFKRLLTHTKKVSLIDMSCLKAQNFKYLFKNPILSNFLVDCVKL